MKTDYPELEGQRIIYLTGPLRIVGHIVGCSYWAGITVKSTKGEFLICLNHKIHSPKYGKKEYQRRFRRIAKMLTAGTFEASHYAKYIMDLGGLTVQTNCAFM